ncbi:hypothetical protein JCM30566_13890 [Marinitoga arctica]
MSPMISVVMSVYNSEKYLNQSIESILNQTYSNFEFIIINDNSIDNSEKIILEYKKQDNRIIYFKTNNNLGLTKNLNYGIKISTGKFIARMDADDIAFPERFEKQIYRFKMNKRLDILGTCAIDIDEYGNEINKRTVPHNYKEIIKMLPKLDPLIHPTVMMKKRSIEKINYYDEKYKTSQDYNLWFKAIANNLYIENLKDFLLYYRVESKYKKKRSLKFRINDMILRFEGYKMIKLPIYKYYYIFIPIILGITPDPIYRILKKFDPR